MHWASWPVVRTVVRVLYGYRDQRHDLAERERRVDEIERRLRAATTSPRGAEGTP